MHDARWWSRLRLVRIFGLICLILLGCGEKGGTDGTVGSGTSRVILHIMVATQERSGLTSRAVIPGQTRQVEDISLLRIQVSGPGIAAPIVVDCPIPAGAPPQCQVTATSDAFVIVINLTVPNGSGRTLAVTGFDQGGKIIQSGTTTLDLTGAVQTVNVGVTITNTGVTITPENLPPTLTGSVGTTSTLHGKRASGADGDPLTFTWALLIRPSDSQATVGHPIGVNPTLVVDRPGIYMVQLTVNNGQMDSLPDVVTIHIVDVDGSALVLDDDLLTFAWLLIATPPDSTAVLSHSSAENPTLMVDLPGIYVVQLVIDDGLMDSTPGDSDD